MADVGTHLADLALWIIAPDSAVDYHTDIHLLDADRWPLVLSEEQFRVRDSAAGLPRRTRTAGGRGAALLRREQLPRPFTLRGVHVKLTTTWEYEAPPGGGDTHNAIAHGHKASVAIRQSPGRSPSCSSPPPTRPTTRSSSRVLQIKCDDLRRFFPGLGLTITAPRRRLRHPRRIANRATNRTSRP